MSKLKSALLLSVALSPIFVSAARGIEVVHAEVVQPNVVQPVKAGQNVMQPVKAGQNVDEAATPNHSSRANHQAHKGKIIAFDDNNFTKKFEESSFFKKSKSKLGIDNVTIKDDAKWATDTANYIGQMIAARVESLKNRPDLKAALNLGGVIGSFISMLCDWLLPTKVDENLEKIKELNERLTALGTNMTESSAAVGEKVDQAAIDEKMTAFKNTLVGCKTTYTSFDSDLQAKGISIKDLIQNPDQEKAKKCADAYKELYSSPDFGVDEVNGTVDEKSENTENFTKLCQFGTAIASANRYNNDIFQLFSDYESLKEYFNTSTFAARDTFEELTMRVYSACLDQMQTAILFDYYRVEGQIKYITQNKDTEADDFDDKFPLTSSLLDKLKLAARNDLYRLGFDTVTAGHVSYEIDDYINNKWVLASDPTNTKVKNLYNTLASNSKAVNYAFANSVENKPVKTFVRFNPKYDEYVKQDAQYQKYLFDLQDKISGLEYQIVNLRHEQAESEAEFQKYLNTISQQANFNSQDIAKLIADHVAASKKIEANISEKRNDVQEKKNNLAVEVDKYTDFKMKNKVEGNDIKEIYEQQDIKDSNGKPLPGKLKTEEHVSDRGNLMYSYRNKSWIYTSLSGPNFLGIGGGIPSWYVAKYLANKYGLKDIKNLDSCDAASRIWKNNHSLNDTQWNTALDHLPAKTLNPSSDFLSVLNTNALAKGLPGVNTLLQLNECHEVSVNHKNEKGAVISTEKVAIPGFRPCLTPNKIVSFNYNLLGSEAYQPSYAPTFQINLGYYLNNKYHNPDKSDKTFYQNLHTSSAADYSFNEEAYDNTVANFITIPHDGDEGLEYLDNGKKVPEKPETDVENDI